jgi:hypothetical protein
MLLNIFKHQNHNDLELIANLAPLVDDGDAGAACECRRLDDPLCAAALPLPHASEQLGVGGQTEGSRQKTEFVFSEFQPESVVVFPQPILATDVKCACNNELEKQRNK